MYHIKNDKRAHASAELICSGLLELIKTVPFEQITISDIQRVSTVSRSTFYRNFDCIEDVLMLLCDRGFDAALKRAGETGEEIRVAVFHYWFENASLLETIVKIHRTDILVESLRRSEEIKLKFRPYIKDEMVFDYFSGVIASAMVGILSTWIEHGRVETEEEVMRNTEKAFVKLVTLGIMGRYRIRK